jgi:CBS domain containing-hemolysin-like protein
VTAVLIPIGIILLLVLANSLFVAAEFAIVGAPRASIEHKAAQGSRLAQRVQRILDTPKQQDRYIATTQIGISVASLGLGMYGEHVVADWVAQALAPLGENRWIAAHTVATIVALALLTYVHIVVGEMVPKALALQRADRTALYVSPVITALGRAILPLVVGLNGIGNGILRLIGVKRQEVESERYHTPAELQFIIKESQEGGLLRGEAGRILRELFEFGDLTAAQVMVPRVHIVGIPAGASTGDLRGIVRTNPHTRYPVHAADMDHIVGSLHIKELLRHLVADKPVTAGDARRLPYVPATAPLDQVLAAMRRYRSQMAVVMDEQGGTAGIVTIEDLFEEVVGDIDEGRDRRPIMRGGDGRVTARGTVRLKEVGDALGITLEHPEVHSVSGLVLALLSRPPMVGDVVSWRGARIQVLSVAGRGVGEAMIQRADAPDNKRPPT